MEHRQFQIDQNLLYNVITRQAGSIEKAWLEGIMNSVDADATNIELSIDRYFTKLHDNGHGMTEEEVIEYFEIFGRSLDPREKKKYGEFRMGRGQLFAQGENTWKTRENVMVVDIQNKGLGYLLGRSDETVDGTKIEVKHYTPLGEEDVVEKTRLLGEWVRYVKDSFGVEIIVNGELVTQNMKELYKGDGKYFSTTRTADYGVDLEASGINIYNQGIFVRKIWEQGIGGDINSKQPLKVNFARNDIMYYCNVYRQIRRELGDIRTQVIGKRIESGKPLSDENRLGLAKAMVRDETARRKFADAPIFKTANEGWASLSDLIDSEVSMAKLGDVLADKSNNEKGIIFLDASIAGTFKDLITKGNIELVPYNEATSGIEFGLIVFEPSTQEESYNLERAIEFAELIGVGRKVKIANKSCTDGMTTIYLSQDLVSRLPLEFIVEGTDTILHEASHEDSTVLTEVHGDTFYRTFHEKVRISSYARLEIIRKVLEYDRAKEQVEEPKEESPKKRWNFLKR